MDVPDSLNLSDWNTEEMMIQHRKNVEFFQDRIGQFFPHLRSNFDACNFEYAWVETRIFGNPTYTVKKAMIPEEFKRLRRAIKTLRALQDGHWFLTVDLHPLHKNPVEPEFIDLVRKLHDLICNIQMIDEDYNLNDILNQYEILIFDSIKNMKDKKNINWQGVDAIDAFRILWWRNTGKHAPGKALNPESRFADYLRTVFYVFDIEGDPVSAFRRWSLMN